MNTDQETFRIGDLVRVRDEYAKQHQGKIWRISKILKVNVLAEPIGGGRSLRVNPELLEAAPEGTEAQVKTIPFLPTLWPGQVVTVSGPGWREPKDRFYVVIRQGNDEKVKIARLGGDDGRYWSSVPRAMITVEQVAVVKVEE